MTYLCIGLAVLLAAALGVVAVQHLAIRGLREMLAESRASEAWWRGDYVSRQLGREPVVPPGVSTGSRPRRKIG